MKEIAEAEITLLIANQDQHFQEEMKYLKEKKGKRQSLVSQLDMFLSSDGLIRYRGRLQYGNIIFALPKSSADSENIYIDNATDRVVLLANTSRRKKAHSFKHPSGRNDKRPKVCCPD